MVESNFTNVIPDFGACDGEEDTATTCDNCECKDPEPVQKTNLCVKCKEKKPTLKLKVEAVC